jgi:hypothetical protein
MASDASACINTVARDDEVRNIALCQRALAIDAWHNFVPHGN